MAGSPNTPSANSPEEAQRRLTDRRRRLERIAARYQQLDEALETLESLIQQCAPRSESPPETHRPRKPR
ncbi:MAG: hypothetical protein KY475_10125 [Planctomycetes bacterium]|nr:hypothetical protein [Planctomycetota bacterium]